MDSLVSDVSQDTEVLHADPAHSAGAAESKDIQLHTIRTEPAVSMQASVHSHDDNLHRLSSLHDEVRLHTVLKCEQPCLCHQEHSYL